MKFMKFNGPPGSHIIGGKKEEAAPKIAAKSSQANPDVGLVQTE